MKRSMLIAFGLIVMMLAVMGSTPEVGLDNATLNVGFDNDLASGGASGESWSGEVKTAMFAMDTLNSYDHASDRFDAYRDSADYLYKLGANCPEFA